MSESSSASRRSPSPSAGRPSSGEATTPSSLERSGSGVDGAALQTDRGLTRIASSVVAKIAGMATREIPGVQAMGKSLTRTFGSLRARVPGGSQATTQGVTVEVGERQAAVDIDIVAYYGQSIVETAEAIRHNVIEKIEAMTGLEVVEVNISVDDLFIESDGADSSQGSRVE